MYAIRSYYEAFGRSLAMGALVAAFSMGLALLFATMADRVVRGAHVYKTLLVWPYAVAPALAGVLWFLMFNPTIGVVGYTLNRAGISWNHYLDGDQAFLLVVLAASWKEISYDFVFFLAGLQSIPRGVIVV